MTKASDNEFPSVLLAEQGSNPATPGAGLWRVYAKATGLFLIDDAGTVVGPFATFAGGTFAGDIIVPDEAYGAGWNGSLEVPTKNAVYDKIESVVAGSGVPPDCYEAILTTPVTMVNANTFYDGPSLSLPAGTYLIEAEADTSSASALATAHTIRIYDGTTVHAARLSYNPPSNAGGGAHLACKARVTLSGTTTVKLQCASVRGSSDGVILDTAAANGTADKCTRIAALKVTSA
jgi:hypothetical protein